MKIKYVRNFVMRKSTLEILFRDNVLDLQKYLLVNSG